MLIHHPAQEGSPCLCRGIGGVSQVYHFEYDNFDNTTSISVGSNKEYTLASYVYAAKNDLLTAQSYEVSLVPFIWDERKGGSRPSPTVAVEDLGDCHTSVRAGSE